VKHFQKSNDIFIINLPSDSDYQIQKLSKIKFLQSFAKLYQLIKNSTPLIIEKEEIPYFEYLGQILDNQTILKACNSFTSESKFEIIFSSSHLKHVPRKQKNLLLDFSLIVNGITFQVNYSLFCSVCDKFYETGRQLKEFTVSIPEQFFKCFESFIKLFDGQKFYFSSFSFDSLIFLIDLFGISCLIPFLTTQIPIPKTIQD
jgi:hypothetical protein